MLKSMGEIEQKLVATDRKTVCDANKTEVVLCFEMGLQVKQWAHGEFQMINIQQLRHTLIFESKYGVMVQEFFCDNNLSHSVKKINKYLNKIDFKDICLLKLPACLPNLNPTENLWRILKRKVYIHGQQFNNRDELWN